MSALELKPGRFYKSKAGDVWCCYRVDKKKEVQAQANCVQIDSFDRVEYFYLDGRYDSDGKREHSLVEECGPNGGPLTPSPYRPEKIPSRGLNALRDEAFRIAREHGFKDASVGEDLMLMVTELAEAMEDHRIGRLPHEMHYELRGTAFTAKERAQSTEPSPESFKPCGIPSELADVVIRVLHFSGKHGVDIEKAVEEKMAFNETRPFKHGGKVV